MCWHSHTDLPSLTRTGRAEGTSGKTRADKEYQTALCSRDHPTICFKIFSSHWLGLGSFQMERHLEKVMFSLFNSYRHTIMPCAPLASLWRVERLTLRAAGPGVASSSWCNWHCATWCMHQWHQTFRHDTCAEILTCLSRVAFAIGVTRRSSLSSPPLAPLTSKPHALPLILPLTPMHTGISAFAKKAQVLQIAPRSSAVPTRKRLCQRAVPGWQMQIVSAATSSVSPPGNRQQAVWPWDRFLNVSFLS